MCIMLCAQLDWQYAELPSSASDAVLQDVVLAIIMEGVHLDVVT